MRWPHGAPVRGARGRSQTAMSALFCLTGVLSAFWGAALPATDARLELGAARLSGPLLAHGAGMPVAMPGAGWLARRWSGRRLLAVAAPASALALIEPASASASASAFAPLACFAYGFGLLLGVLRSPLLLRFVADAGSAWRDPTIPPLAPHLRDYPIRRRS